MYPLYPLLCTFSQICFIILTWNNPFTNQSMSPCVPMSEYCFSLHKLSSCSLADPVGRKCKPVSPEMGQSKVNQDAVWKGMDSSWVCADLVQPFLLPGWSYSCAHSAGMVSSIKVYRSISFCSFYKHLRNMLEEWNVTRYNGEVNSKHGWKNLNQALKCILHWRNAWIKLKQPWESEYTVTSSSTLCLSHKAWCYHHPTAAIWFKAGFSLEVKVGFNLGKWHDNLDLFYVLAPNHILSDCQNSPSIEEEE